MKEPELKPCPFCGGTSTLLLVGSYGDLYYVSCSDCTAHGPTADTRNDAAIAWNTRKGESHD